jgi:large subunit ribosomal protein L9
MEIILLQDVEKVGDKFEIVTVKDGYGRNFLIPQKMGVIANKTNRAKLAELRAKDARKAEKEIAVHQDIIDRLNGEIIKIGAKAGTSGKIFGSVTNVQISAAIKEQHGIDIERRRITIDEEVKNLGVYTANITFSKDLSTKLTFEVVEE